MLLDFLYFRFLIFGNVGSIYFDFLKDFDMIEFFTCIQIKINRYKISLLKLLVKVFGLFIRVSIRIDNRGFLFL